MEVAVHLIQVMEVVEELHLLALVVVEVEELHNQALVVVAEEEE